jgi:hypothetical protein
MAPTLVLSVGFAIDGTPTSLYLGNDFAAAEAAAAAGRGTYPLIQIFRNLAPYQEFRSTAA